jgi:hypothetical protein
MIIGGSSRQGHSAWVVRTLPLLNLLGGGFLEDLVCWNGLVIYNEKVLRVFLVRDFNERDFA